MKFHVLTLFPDMFESVMGSSIAGRASASGLICVHYHDIRAFADNKHSQADDYPFGGGSGMVMMPQPAIDCIRHVKALESGASCIHLSPRGALLNQQKVKHLSCEKALILLCSHYEGIDQRVIDSEVDEELSVGDYVLTGGELAAMVVIDAVMRYIPGVLGSAESIRDESFSDEGLLEYPQYTRPQLYEGMEVPDILLSGHHANIQVWRRQQSLLTTLKKRPDLLERAGLTEAEREWLNGQTSCNRQA